MPEAPILTFFDKTLSIGEIYDYWDVKDHSLYLEECPFCCLPCTVLKDDFIYSTAEQYDRAAVCPRCGWWSFESDQVADLSNNANFYSSRALLKRFAVDADDVPSQALADYLTQNSDRLKDISPKKFEALVADVYRDVLGYKIEFCSYCRPDRGIDVIAVNQESGSPYAIQVKRYSHPIELGLIHQFFGAIVESQMERGVFVTTSKFRQGCHDVKANLANLTGIQIDLVDGSRFLEFLNLYNTKKEPVACPEWHQHGYMVNYENWK